MDIVDAQLHLGKKVGVPEALASMDALGIQAAIVDEFWGLDPASGHPQPGYVLPQGVFRPVGPSAEQAAICHPTRFSFLLRVDHRDPDLNERLGYLASAPHAHAVRLDAQPASAAVDFAAGRCERLFAAAARYALPVFVLCPGQAARLRAYAARYPEITVIVDHVGSPGNEQQFADLLALADLPNVAVKWAHATTSFDAHDYPFERTIPYLRRCLDAFGCRRLMWASDVTEVQGGHPWAELLFSVRDSGALSAEEKTWVLGQTVRTLLHWPRLTDGEGGC